MFSTARQYQKSSGQLLRHPVQKKGPLGYVAWDNDYNKSFYPLAQRMEVLAKQMKEIQDEYKKIYKQLQAKQNSKEELLPSFLALENKHALLFSLMTDAINHFKTDSQTGHLAVENRKEAYEFGDILLDDLNALNSEVETEKQKIKAMVGTTQPQVTIEVDSELIRIQDYVNENTSHARVLKETFRGEFIELLTRQTQAVQSIQKKLSNRRDSLISATDETYKKILRDEIKSITKELSKEKKALSESQENFLHSLKPDAFNDYKKAYKRLLRNSKKNLAYIAKLQSQCNLLSAQMEGLRDEIEGDTKTLSQWTNNPEFLKKKTRRLITKKSSIIPN